MRKRTDLILAALLAVAAALMCFALSGCADKDNGGGDGTYVDYKLDSFTCSVSGIGDTYISIEDMSASDHASYDAVITLYGKTVSISDKKIKFVDGTSFKSLGAMSYTLNGDKMTVSETAVSSIFNNITLKNGVFSFGIKQAGVSYGFDYYAPGVSAPSYTVSFDTGGFGSIDSKTVKKGQTLPEPTEPSRNGYTFGGWYTDESHTNAWDFASSKVTSDMTLHALWVPELNTVTFDTKGGGSVKAQYILTGERVRYPDAPQRDGYYLDGWYSDPDCGYESAWNFDDPVTEDMTLYAKWTPEEYTLIFDARGGTCDVENKRVRYLSELGELPTPSREGFEFVGWYDRERGGNRMNVDSVFDKTSDFTLYARWQTTVTLDTDGLGFVSKTSIKVQYGNRVNTVEDLPSVSHDSATFVGWYTERSGKGVRITNYDIYNFDGPVTLYAAWRLNVTYNAAGGTSVSGSSVIRGQTFTPASTSRRGYTFAGWYDEACGVVDENTIINKDGSFTLTAHWMPNEITFTFDAQGGSVPQSSEVYTFDAALGSLPTPVKANNRFGGWFTEVGGAGREYTAESTCDSPSSLRLYAKWIVNITFEYGGATSGNSVVSTDAVYNSAVDIRLPSPYKDGYSFEGWFTGANGGGDKVARFFIGNSPVCNFDGNTSIYAYWVKGTDKRDLTYSVYDDAVTVTGLDSTLTRLEIPAIIDLKPVTRITQNAFYGDNLTFVAIPNSVISIGAGAFRGCPITDLTLPFIGLGSTATKPEQKVLGAIFGSGSSSDSGVTNQGGTYFFIPSVLKRVTVTGSVLPESAFRNCTMIEEIAVNSGITEIDNYVFGNCPSLTRITGIENVTKVGSYAFWGCKNMIAFPTRPLTRVGEYAFYNCTGLTEVSLGDGLASVGRLAFANSGITEIAVPNSVETIGEGVFANCLITDLTLPFIGLDTGSYNDDKAVLGILFAKASSTDVEQEGSSFAIIEQRQYTYYRVPLTLKRVTLTGRILYDYAFANCSMIQEVEIAQDTVSLPDYTFYKCTALTRVGGMKNVTSVGDYAFCNCFRLTTLPTKPLDAVGNYAFFECRNLTSVSFGNTIEYIGNGAFRYTSLTSVTVPNNVTHIGIGAFGDCALREISVPFVGETTGYMDEKERVFGVIFGYTQTETEGYTYQYSGFWYKIPQTLEKVTVTGDCKLYKYSFKNCTMIKELSFTGRITAIDNYAFESARFDVLRFSAALPSQSVESNAFYAFATGGKIVVPDEYLDDYKAKLPNYNVIAKSEDIPAA